jgi:hypothetical protein
MAPFVLHRLRTAARREPPSVWLETGMRQITRMRYPRQMWPSLLVEGVGLHDGHDRIDPRKRSHTAVALDEHDAVLGELRVTAGTVMRESALPTNRTSSRFPCGRDAAVRKYGPSPQGPKGAGRVPVTASGRSSPSTVRASRACSRSVGERYADRCRGVP